MRACCAFARLRGLKSVAYFLAPPQGTARMHVLPHHTAQELRSAIHREPNGRVRDRIRGVLKAKHGLTAEQVAAELDVSRRAVQDWVRWYNEGKLENLSDAPRTGAPRKCPRDKFDAVRARIEAGPIATDEVCTLRGVDVQRILAAEHGVIQKLSTTYKLMHELGLEPLIPRPRHVKNNPEAMTTWLDQAPPLSAKSAKNTLEKRLKSGSRMKPGSASKAR